MAKETDKKKTTAKAADKKPAKAAEKKTTAKKADDKKAAKTAEKKAAEKKPAAKTAEKKATAKTAEKKVAEKKPAAKKADTSKLDALIKAAVADGKITDTERKVLEKRAKEEGFDKDELSMLLDASLYAKKDVEKKKKEPAEEKKSEEKKDPQDPFNGLMVTVEGGIFTQTWERKILVRSNYIEYPNNDKRRKPIYHDAVYECRDLSRRVRMNTFKICKYQVTQAQWKSVMGKDNNPSHFKGDDLPVECVSWDDAQEFIKKLNAKTGKHYALPTEAQWEFAARGGNKSKNYEYAGCNWRDLDDYAWYSKNSSKSTHTVGKKKPNELGLYDMSGNVWEWCEDWYEEGYPSGDIADPKGPSSGQNRVQRGGSWIINAWYCRVTHRIGHDPSYRDNSFGLRLVLLP